MTHLVRKRVDGDTKRPCQTKISDLEFSFPVDKEILRLEIAMENLIFVAKRGAFEQLEHEAAHCGGVEGASIAVLIHVLFEVLLAVLKNQDQLRFRMYHVVKADDVDVLQFFHEGNLAYSCRGCALLGV